MLKTVYSAKGMMVAPHHLAAQAGRDILREGGNAVEAMVAAAATIATVYPHMNSIGGDGFWLIHEPGKAPVAIDACGRAAKAATLDFYSGHKHIPSRGPMAALTCAGTVSGWQQALDVARAWGHSLPLARLLEPATAHAREGIVVTESQANLTHSKRDQLESVPGFADVFMPAGEVPQPGTLLRQGALANTLEQLARAGLDDFYRGELARAMGEELARLGSPITAADLNEHRAMLVQPLQVQLPGVKIYNLPPPTQGLASLIILGVFEKLGVEASEDFDFVHGLVESTKQAFRVRDRVVTDPDRVPESPQNFLTDAALAAMAGNIDTVNAQPWPDPASPGDTIWMGCIDGEGRAVSFIQSIYWEFGSGVVLKDTGVNWQNRGISFSLEPTALQALEPGRKPFHTLNPALALFDDGRTMSYGTMGGEGQPQTQAMIFSRYGLYNQPLQQAVTAPRWLLGRTWGDTSTTLKLENRFPRELVDKLRKAGHEVEELEEAFSDTMGHAGALVRRANGIIEGAADPRSDGTAAAL
ncbi:gamma-glutamyltransferase family protein [Marinobacter nanhaiticus D15-8W]|uniref:Gamma-glutamyltransferase family protein n=1 Tax=Marinobacter nanhaiticus D15-8W TaxID=626887 RepID=N6W035_9GAMM|nr:gamma-glutamyltransferase family protein [Marinobacter nanhaiticus]ENO15890.1 gamma-glutamyltransferase family protein [Marinobacter nanhaiticus D15-8W]BES73252.1 gamma-glutamyltransferase family protein [Marinobacter nanhaiticus D15-8W]